MPPGAAEPPASSYRHRPFPHRAAPGLLGTGPCRAGAGSTGAGSGLPRVLSTSPRVGVRCPVPVRPPRASPAAPCPPRSPFPIHPPRSPAVALSPPGHPRPVHPPHFPSSCPHTCPASPCRQSPGRGFQPPQPQGQHSTPVRHGEGVPPAWEGRGHSGSLEQVWGQTLLPRANPKEICGLFCSIFKAQRPGKLEPWEVGREEMPAGNAIPHGPRVPGK